MINHLTHHDWVVIFISALIIGAEKGGLRSINIVVLPILAAYFGAMRSSAILVPILVLADLAAVYYYRKNIAWAYMKKLLPSAVCGLFLGMVVGKMVPDEIFRLIMVTIILLCLGLMLVNELRVSPLMMPDKWYLHTAVGLLGGFSTMIGNVSGPILAVYLLMAGLPKKNYISTGAFFFLFMNLLKLPIHGFVWHSLTSETLLVSLYMIPCVLAGVYSGARIVKFIPERPFRYFILSGAFMGSIGMIQI